MPQSEKDFDEDIELSDAPPIDEGKNDSAPEDDSNIEEDTKLKPKATSNGTSEPVVEEIPAEKKSKVEDMFDDDDDEYGMNDDEDARMFSETEAAIEYGNSRMRYPRLTSGYLSTSTDQG